MTSHRLIFVMPAQARIHVYFGAARCFIPAAGRSDAVNARQTRMADCAGIMDLRAK